MAIRNIRRHASNPGAYPGTPTSAPIYVDSDDNILKIIPAGSGTTEVQVIDASSTQTLTGKTFGSNLTAGSGVSAAETYKTSVVKNGNLYVTSIVVDLTGLVGSATDLDIIGNSGGTASANFGQFVAAASGTAIGGKVTCLEVPAGGTADIDFYSAVESTGAQDALVTSLDEVALVTSGGAWTSGATKGMTLLPRAGDYFYITNGAAAGGTFTAGKFLIEVWGS